MRTSLKLIVFAFLPLLFAFVPLAAHAGDDSLKEEILELINQHRKKKHLPPLQMNVEIGDVCQKHSKNMAKKKVDFGHDGFDERDVVLQKKIPHAHIAENVAYGTLDAKGVVDLWLHSPGHKKNIEGNFDLAGIGIEKGSGDYLYFTMIFLKKEIILP